MVFLVVALSCVCGKISPHSVHSMEQNVAASINTLEPHEGHEGGPFSSEDMVAGVECEEPLWIGEMGQPCAPYSRREYIDRYMCEYRKRYGQRVTSSDSDSDCSVESMPDEE